MAHKDFEYTIPVGRKLTGGQHSYKIEDVLGQGSFGITYKVSAEILMGNIPIKAFFAVKEHFVRGYCYRGADGMTMEYSKASAEKVEESLADFKKEANRLKKICQGNKNIVNVNEVFYANNTAYFVMEYIDGGDLRSLIKESRGGMPEQQALDIMIPIANAVSFIHQQGIMHLDIKPDNIVIRKDTKEPVLIDFGISLHFNKKGELTTKHISAGATQGYAPMEQFVGITRFAPEVDVYALAATLFYLLVGKNPISANEIRPEDIEKALPSSLRGKIREAIINGMKRDGHERTQTAKEFVEALQGHMSKGTYRPLRSNNILQLGSTDYLIIQVAKENEFHIRYSATRFTGKYYGAGSNTTVKKEYDIYEYFAKDVHVRQNDNSVIVVGNESPTKGKFFDLASKLHINKDDVFEANGTWYYVKGIVQPTPVPIYKYVKICVGMLLALLIIYIAAKYRKALPEQQDKMPDSTLVETLPDDSILDEHKNNSERTNKVDDEKIELMVPVTKPTSVTDMNYKSSLGTFKYSGSIDENGKPHGRGTATNNTFRYIGPFVHGIMQGSDGILQVKKSYGIETFRGSFRGNLFTNGTYIRPDSTFFKGTFSRGQPAKGEWYDKEGYPINN